MTDHGGGIVLDQRDTSELLLRRPLTRRGALVLLAVGVLTTHVWGQVGRSDSSGKSGRAYLAPPTTTTRPLGRPHRLVQVVEDVPTPLLAKESTPAEQPLPPIRGSEPLQDGFRPPITDERARDRASRFVLERIDPQLTIDLQVDRPVILRLKQPPFRDQISNPEIVEMLNITDTEMSLVGRQPGTTVLNFWFEDETGQQSVLSYLVRVASDFEDEVESEDEAESGPIKVKLAKLEDQINRAFPNSFVRLQYVGNQVVVRGQAKDVEEGAAIVRIVASSIGDSERAIRAIREGSVVNDDLNQLPSDSVFILERGAIAALEEGQSLPSYLRGDTASGASTFRINNRIVNLLEIGGLHQVMLKVTVAEVNRSAVRAIGADLRVSGSSTNFFSLLPLAELGIAGTGGTFLVNRGDFDLAINALKQLNLARSLAEPNLVTLNGQPANFQVGGEFPIPVVTGATADGLQGVEFVPFGVQLQFIPNVTDGDRIRLNLQATVSTRTDDTTNINGSNITGLNSRNFQSTVELREGQTIAIAGLIQSNLGATSDRVPFAGDIPFLGRLFSSDRTSYDEQELIVLVTPYLVNPIDASVEPLALPGSDYFEPDDLEFFLRGSLTGHIAEDFRSPARTDIHQVKAFRRMEQELIIGQPGHSNGLLCPSVDTKVHP